MIREWWATLSAASSLSWPLGNSVLVNYERPRNFDFRSGVPQGGCLGFILFFIVQGTRLFHIVEKYLLSVQGYADYTSFLGSRQKLSNMNNDCIHVGASEIKLVSSVRNLGPWFDSSLSVNEQVGKAKRSAACTTYRKSGSCRIRRINQDSDLRIHSSRLMWTIATRCCMAFQHVRWIHYSDCWMLLRVSRVAVCWPHADSDVSKLTANSFPYPNQDRDPGAEDPSWHGPSLLERAVSCQGRGSKCLA